LDFFEKAWKVRKAPKEKFVSSKELWDSKNCPPQMLQPHFEASVKMRLALPKVGTWSPPRLPKL
jgi:hypothetical protein